MQPAPMAKVQPDPSVIETARRELKRHVGDRNYDNWFHQKTVLTICGHELLIGVASSFLLTWMQKQFRTAALQAAQTALGSSAQVRFQVDESLPSTKTGRDKTGRGKTDSRDASPPSQRASRPVDDRSPRRRFLSLKDFVEGECNRLAFIAANQVSDSPGSRFNPLYIHGGVGVGKTHLLEGIYGRIRRRFPALKVMYLTSEAFTNYFTQALREHTLPSFRQRFRNVDVLLVDDIDFFDGKRGIQEEFLHTFKQLESHSRQIMIASDRHPRLFSKLNDELTTRFVSGLVCRIESPDFETRKRIVELKASRTDLSTTHEALTFVAQRFRNNVRELEGALNCLESYSAMTGKRIGVTVARKVLADLERDCIRIVGIPDVEKAICEMFGVGPSELRSAKRRRTISQPRMLAMFLARKHTQAAYSEIGQYFGGRNHSTVMAAERRVQDWLDGQDTITVAAQTWSMPEVLETLEQQLLAG